MVTMVELRQYQIDALEAIDAALREEQNVLLQAIMGAGKTTIAVRLIRRYALDYHDMRFLVLAHKQELVEQFAAAFARNDVPAEEIGIVCAGLNRRETDRRITIGTIQTFINALGEYPGADLVIIDEAHRIDINGDTQYRKTIDTLREYRPECRILGLTATPARLGHGYIYGNRCRPGSVNLFPRVHHKITYQELVSHGYLMPLQGKVAVHDQLTEDLVKVAKRGDYVLEQLGQVMAKGVHIQTAVRALADHGAGYDHVVAFCCTIEHAERLRAAFLDAGESATVIHSKLSPAERRANLDGWMAGEYRIICGVNILAEGFDFPPADCILMARPTLSSSLYLQTIGRIVRTYPGKTKALLIDLTDNTRRFGLDLDNIKVSIPGGSKGSGDRAGEAAPMAKDCPDCGSAVHPRVRFCPECGHEWVVEEAEETPEVVDVEFHGAEPQWYDVRRVEYVEHESQRSSKMVFRVIYDCGGIFHPKRFSDWVCFEHDGYARRKAERWWIERSDEPVPDTVAEAAFLAHTLREPARVLVDESGEWPRVLDYDFLPESIDMPEWMRVEEFDDIPF